MNEKDDNVISSSEYIKDRLYYVTYKGPKLKATSNVHHFTVDTDLVYEKFFVDFGPLNLAMLYRFCNKLNTKLKTWPKKKIVFYSSTNFEKRANAAYLIASYAIIYLKKTPEQAYEPLVTNKNLAFVPFRDASSGPNSLYTISLLDCLNAVSQAIKFKFLDFENFDVKQYEFYERVENGDLNWIIPNKFIAFCGPHKHTKNDSSYPVHTPESYLSFFRKNNVSTVVRLNKKMYSASSFTDYGIDHVDLFFEDGTTPSDAIMRQFLEIAEKAKGCIAVHCKAGLGRTGTLIACYMMKHYHMRATEAIAWIRIMRPGSVIGQQQLWLQQKQLYLWLQGENMRGEQRASKRKGLIINTNLNNKEEPVLKDINDDSPFNEKDLTKVFDKELSITEEDKSDSGTSNNCDNIESPKCTGDAQEKDDDKNNNNREVGLDAKGMSQGDRLNKIKTSRKNHARSATTDDVKTCTHRSHHRTATPQPSLPTTTVTSPLKANKVKTQLLLGFQSSFPELKRSSRLNSSLSSRSSRTIATRSSTNTAVIR